MNKNLLMLKNNNKIKRRTSLKIIKIFKKINQIRKQANQSMASQSLPNSHLPPSIQAIQSQAIQNSIVHIHSRRHCCKRK
jgi:hypothetical protein